MHALFSVDEVYDRRTWDIDHVLAEDDLVTLHCTMHACTTAGNEYHGSYHMLFRVADGRSPRRGSSSTPPTCSSA